MDYVYGLSLEYLVELTLWIAAGAFVLRLFLRARRRCRGQRRLRWVHLGLSVWMLLACMTALEIYLAFFYDQTDSFNVTNTSAAWHRRHVTPFLNNVEFRDVRKLEQRRPAGQTAIWFLGDSFTMGHGVRRIEDRFSDRIAAVLEQRSPGRFSVNTIADMGAHTITLRVWLQTLWGHGYDPPDVAVYVLCLNDIQPYLPENPEDATPRPTAWSWLVDRSFLLDFVRSRLWQRRLGARDWYADMAAGYDGPPGQKVLLELDHLREVCRRKKTDFRVVLFPFLHDLGPNYSFAAAHQRIAEHCRQKQIQLLDLRPTLEPHVSEGLMVNRFDTHPNERAHALAAQAIERDLLNDLVPR